MMEWLPVAWDVAVLLFVVAVIAGLIDAIAGGGGLIVLPILLSVGLLPTEALATNKLQSVGGSFSASLYFIRHKAVNLSGQKFNILLTFLGAAMGTILIQLLDIRLLRMLLPLLIIAVGLYFLFSPGIGQKDGYQRVSFYSFALVLGGIGFYDGFFGPGAGSFYALAFVLLWGLNISTATAHAKVMNCTSNLAALLFFIIGGHVQWSLGLLMLVGQFIGAQIGAKLVLHKGHKLIRPLLIVMSFIMSGRLIYEQYGKQIVHFSQAYF